MLYYTLHVLTAGNHQLEMAQMTIKVRCLSEQLDNKHAELEALAEAHSVQLEELRGEQEAEVSSVGRWCLHPSAHTCYCM